jgi:hypothetical protein
MRWFSSAKLRAFLALILAIGILVAASFARPGRKPFSEDVWAQIREGMTEEELVHLLGPAGDYTGGPYLPCGGTWIVPADPADGLARVLRDGAVIVDAEWIDDQSHIMVNFTHVGDQDRTPSKRPGERVGSGRSALGKLRKVRAAYCEHVSPFERDIFSRIHRLFDRCRAMLPL